MIQTGAFGGLVTGLIVVYCYVQGFRGAMDLAELRKSEETTLSQPAT